MWAVVWLLPNHGFWLPPSQPIIGYKLFIYICLAS